MAEDYVLYYIISSANIIIDVINNDKGGFMVNKIICLGDSITKGKVWNENERRPYITENSYPSLLKNMLNLDVENIGICDITSEMMLQHVENNDIKFEKDSAVIIEIGGNDCNPNWREIKKDPDGEHCPAISLENFKCNLMKIIGTVKDYGAIPILSTLPPLDPERYFNLLRKIFGDGIKRWIDKNGGIFKWQERYSDVVNSIAGLQNVRLIDVRNAFLNTENYKKYMSLDGVHPNEQGYLLIAKTCCRCLGKWLLPGGLKSDILMPKA